MSTLKAKLGVVFDIVIFIFAFGVGPYVSAILFFGLDAHTWPITSYASFWHPILQGFSLVLLFMGIPGFIGRAPFLVWALIKGNDLNAEKKSIIAILCCAYATLLGLAMAGYFIFSK